MKTIDRVGCGPALPALVGLAGWLLASGPAGAVPSYARQTGMACSACHTVFPELTPFGREFKLNGYVLDNIRQVKGISLDNKETLGLNSTPPISLMLQVSYTHTSKALPDSALSGALAKNGDILFPQQASLFYAGKIADGLGSFLQLTYDGVGDSFGFDNTDIRYARHFSVGGADRDNLILGLTLNNGPTIQDVWNTTAAWGFPYAGSSTAPGPVTSTKLDAGAGSLIQSTAGLGVYAWFNDSLYAELTLYSAAIRGGTHPLDSTQAGVVHGTSPYFRVAYETRWDRNSLTVGAYGIDAHLHPGNGLPLQGPVDRYRDVAGDVQYQFIGEDHLFTVLSTYIHEKQTLDASYAAALSANPTNDLKTFKLAGEYYYQRTVGGSIGFFSTTGSSDSGLYPGTQTVTGVTGPIAVNGSANNSPNSTGEVVELNYLPWLNAKLQLQYTRYSKFNGASTNYDGAGRNASDNNTTYLLVWLLY
jgi:hypothetical protein